MLDCGVHRLDLAVILGQLFERSDSDRLGDLAADARVVVALGDDPLNDRPMPDETREPAPRRHISFARDPEDA